VALVGIVGGVLTKVEEALEGPVVCLEFLNKRSGLSTSLYRTNYIIG
jgi:hypothetical protein